jgi:ATP synthase protein I
MARDFRPGETAKSGSDRTGGTGGGDEDLERRRRDLEASLAARLPDRAEGQDETNARNAGSYGQAFKLSSEFIAAIAVGIGIGWVLDHWAGTSPFGLIVFLLLGFGGGILNVLRSVGQVAEFGQGGKPPAGPKGKV